MSVTLLKEKEQIDVAQVPIEAVKRMAGSKILVSHRNKAAAIYQLSQNLSEHPSRIIKEYRNHRSLVADAIYAETGDKIITVSRRIISIFDRETKQVVKFTGHDRDITTVAINKENTKIVTGSQDGTFILWNTKGEMISKVGNVDNGHKGWINCVEFIPGTEDLIATASEDGTVKIWDLNSNVLLKTFIDGQFVDYEKLAENKIKVRDNNPDLAVKAVCFSNDGSLMAYGGRNAKISIISLTINEAMQHFDVPSKVTALASGENQPLIAIAIPNKVLLWDIMDEKVIAEYTFSDHNEVYCYSLTFVEDELVVGLTTGKLIRLEISRN
ncbi:hypothetical protein NUSPORA_02353 [Nucleospora cyclopteri]